MKSPPYIYESGKYYADIWVSETGRYWKRWRSGEVNSSTYIFPMCYAKKTFWTGGWYERLSKSPPWFKVRMGCSSDYPYTLFDTQDGPPNRIGLPQYRVNTASLNLILEATLFYSKTLGAPTNMKLVYCSKVWNTGDSVGLFGKNWRLKYESAVGRFGQEAVVLAGSGRTLTYATPKGESLDTYTGAALELTAPEGIYDTMTYYYNGGSSYFELKMKSTHMTYVYGAAGSGASNTGLFYLTAIKDQFNNQTSLVIDKPTGKITSITDSSSRAFTFTYDGNNHCTNISMPDGRTVSFGYDGSYNLTSITDMMGYVGTYTYDANSFLQTMSVAGKTTTFTYADRPGYDGKAVENPGDKYLASVLRPNGTTVKYELLDEGDTVKRTDASGQVTLISNKDGQTTSIKDPLGSVRSFAYNAAKLPETVTDENGAACKYTYDAVGNVLTKTDALGKVTTYTYDPNDNMTVLTTR